MLPTVAWIVGEPGMGKTTLARALLGSSEPLRLNTSPKWTFSPETVKGTAVIAAGHYRGETFDGADTVPYNGVATALEWWAQNWVNGLTLLDGDRFSFKAAVQFFQTRAPQSRLVCVHLDGPAALASSRRAARGSNQNGSWLKGRATKARRFFDAFPGLKITLDAQASTQVQRDQLIALLELHLR